MSEPLTVAQAEALLPEALPQAPECGHCGASTAPDGDYYVCHDCLIKYDAQSLAGCYDDDDAVLCGEPCSALRHWPGDAWPIFSGLEVVCRPCILQQGHATYQHYNPCTTRPRRAAA